MSQENVEIVREIYHAVARRDAASAFAVYADDIVWEVSARRAIVMDRAYHGHEGVRRFWRDALLAFGEVDLDVEELIDAGDRVVALIREREIGRSSGVPVEASHAAISTLAEGKVVRMQVFDDWDQASKAVGLEE